LLRRVSFFRPLPFAIAEYLASGLEPASYEPGDVIIREGEPGEHFYLIADGSARACKGDEQVSEMGPGESFGEIALLRPVPRQATVTAISHLEVRILARAEFLAAVTGNPESMQSADDLVSTRLMVS
jgi:CRP-like cAMP-binding protein